METDLKFEVLLLAGGVSRRMGTDKRRLDVGGIPLAKRTYDIASSLRRNVRVLVADEGDRQRIFPFVGSDANFCLDADPGAGPLSAIAAELFRCPEWVLVLAVDYPRLTSEFLVSFARFIETSDPEARAAIPVSAGKPQYACAFYHRSLGPGAERAVDAGERSLHRWLRTVEGEVRIIPEEIWTHWGSREVLFNWNRGPLALHHRDSEDTEAG